jgi:1-acyl-sn-glycerol-3-phosphate acyltransferase
MNNSQSSDAVRRKRPAARRAQSSSGSEPPPAASLEDAAPISGENAPAREEPAREEPAREEPAREEIDASTVQESPSQALEASEELRDARPSQSPPTAAGAPAVKRATARRQPVPARVKPPQPALRQVRPEQDTLAHAPELAPFSKAGAAAALRSEREPEGARGRSLTRAHIDHHVREAARLATRLEAADTQPPEHSSFLRRLARLRLLQRSDQVDDFGLDPAYEAGVRPIFEKLCNDYFRMQVDGIQYVPSTGRAILVGNHSGTLPWDGIMLRTVLRLHHASRRDLRWLVEDHVFHAPFLGTFVNRIGAVRACQENAERLLERESLLAVFPEGIKGIAKSYADRYKLQRFGRGGYVRLALRTGAPVIPVAIVGAEEANPLLYKVNAFAKSVGLPFIPVTPTFPWLGPLGMAPLPSRWRIAFGPPIREIARHDADAANDEVLVHELNECVRASVRALLDDALRRRGENVYVG